MNRAVRRLVSGTICFSILLIWARCSAAVDQAGKELPPQPPLSKVAPADDLVAQADYYLKRIEESLSKKDDYDDAAKARVKKDANTLAVLFLTLGMHDTDNRYKAAATALVKNSQALAKAADFNAATAAFSELNKIAAGNGSVDSSASLKWEKVASLGQLMKQLPAISSALKRGLSAEPPKFKQLQKQATAESATLAAIAQAVMADTHEVKNRADMDKWYRYCAEMRDAAGTVNAAVHAGKQEAATEAMGRLAKSCETCHAVFRKEE